MAKSVTHFVYALYHNGLPFYIGMSIDPNKRVHDHFRNNSDPKMYRFMRRVKSTSEISIVILESYVTKRVVKCVNCVEREQKWILKFLKDGFTLVNTVVAYNKYSV